MSANVSSSTNNNNYDGTFCALGTIEQKQHYRDDVEGVIFDGAQDSVVSTTSSPLPHAKGLKGADVEIAAAARSTSSVLEPTTTTTKSVSEVEVTATPPIGAVPSLFETETVASLQSANRESANQQPNHKAVMSINTTGGASSLSMLDVLDKGQQQNGGPIVADDNSTETRISPNLNILSGGDYRPVTPPTTIMLGNTAPILQMQLSAPPSGAPPPPTNVLFTALVPANHTSATATATNNISSSTLTAGLPLTIYPGTATPTSPISAVGNVYVANLRTSTDASRIRAYFQNFGQVLHVKLLLDIATGISRCIAFVMFANFSDALQACSLATKTELDGAIIQVRMAQRGTTVNPDTHVYSPLVFLRNVPSTTLRSEVSAYCEAHFGSLKNITLHPQSRELGGPSPYNMMVLEFHHAEQASLFVEGTDGRARFSVPDNHPLLMAKMIMNPAAEMRKSILLRPSPGSAPQHSQTSNASRKVAGSGGAPALSIMGYAPPPPPPPFQQHQQHVSQQQLHQGSTGAISQLLSPSAALGHPPSTTHIHSGYPHHLGAAGAFSPLHQGGGPAQQHHHQDAHTSMMHHQPQSPPPAATSMSNMIQMRLPNGDVVLVSRGQYQQQGSNIMPQQQQQHQHQQQQHQHQHQQQHHQLFQPNQHSPYAAVQTPQQQQQQQQQRQTSMYTAPPPTHPVSAPPSGLFQHQANHVPTINSQGAGGAQMMYIQLRDGPYAAVPAFQSAPVSTSATPPIQPHPNRHLYSQQQTHSGGPPPPPPSYSAGMRQPQQHPTSTTACIPTYQQLQQQNQLQQRINNGGISPHHF